MATKKDDFIFIGAHLRNRRLEDLKRFANVQAPIEIQVEQEESTLDRGNKVVVRKIVTKKLSDTIDKHLKWYDYSIDSLAAVGALGNQKFVNLDGDVFDDADRISATLETLENNNDNKTDD